MTEKKNIFKIQNPLVASAIVLLVSVAIGISIYMNQQLACPPIQPQVTYWPIVLQEWNPNGNLRTIKRVFDRLGYQMTNGSVADWDIMWSIEYPFDHFPEKMVNLKPHQWINHLPGMVFITNKMYLAVSTQSKYIPVAFEFPRLKNEFTYYNRVNPDKQFVLKNFANRGVKIVKFEDVNFHLGHQK